MPRTETVSEYLIDRLAAVGAERIYGIIGDSLNPVTDALRRDGRLDWVHVRHEEAGAFAAGAEAQLTGKLAVCAGSSGPGNLHLINGLYDAHASAAPVLAIASQITIPELGSEFHQETHPERLYRECSDWCELISSAEQFPRALHMAIQSALANRSVSVIVVPGDIAAQDLPDGGWRSHFASRQPTMMPAAEDLDRLVELIEASERPMIFSGIGAAPATEAILELAERIGAPVGYSFRGKDHFQADNPQEVGMTGLLGFGGAYQAMHECDLLILAGTDFPYRGFLPSDVKAVQIDIRGERLGRRMPLELGVIADAGETARAVLARVAEKQDRSFLEEQRKDHKRQVEKLQGYVEHVSSQHPIHPEYVAARLDQLADDDAVVTLDTGMTTVWGARYMHGSGGDRGRRFLGSFRHGSMANALPQAIGAQLAEPEKQVVSMCGDGGLTMLLGDLLTLVQEELPVKVVVFNNGVLGMVRLEMQVAGLVDFETELKSPDFAALGRACGMHGILVERRDEVDDGLRELLAHDGPAICDVRTDPEALSMPPKISLDQAQGFALSMIKKSLDGHIDEVLSTAKTNIRNVPRP
ncbi:MAG: thiamine pyrophosphate-dependent enzyme [Solirubrobacterales bacterium]